ncbi:MAG: hypothetical protein JW841_04700 [Deltaproteobacteria bacterium]|nr:hypothetical protein [Deltaproteobacteria bacterium]
MPNAALDIRDIKPLVAIPSDLPITIIIIAIATLLLAGVIIWWWLHKRQKLQSFNKIKTVAPIEPPEIIARSALKDLDEKLKNSIISIQQYFYGISLILRTYFEAVFKLNTTDLTTYEISIKIENSAIAKEHRQDFLSILSMADAVKFAKAPATDKECSNILRLAQAFITMTSTTISPTTDLSQSAEK